MRYFIFVKLLVAMLATQIVEAASFSDTTRTVFKSGADFTSSALKGTSLVPTGVHSDVTFDIKAVEPPSSLSGHKSDSRPMVEGSGESSDILKPFTKSEVKQVQLLETGPIDESQRPALDKVEFVSSDKVKGRKVIKKDDQDAPIMEMRETTMEQVHQHVGTSSQQLRVALREGDKVDGTHCILRTVCELKSDPELSRGYEDELVRLMQKIAKNSKRFTKAFVTGATSRSRKLCYRKYPRCDESATTLIKLALAQVEGISIRI